MLFFLSLPFFFSVFACGDPGLELSCQATYELWDGRSGQGSPMKISGVVQRASFLLNPGFSDEAPKCEATIAFNDTNWTDGVFVAALTSGMMFSMTFHSTKIGAPLLPRFNAEAKRNQAFTLSMPFSLNRTIENDKTQLVSARYHCAIN